MILLPGKTPGRLNSIDTESHGYAHDKMNSLAIIIGGMKCGTTSLYNYLIQHPQICSCKQKEPSFFNRPKNYSKGLNYYEKLWDFNPKVHKIRLESSVGYTMQHMFPSTADRIKAAPYDIQFIYIMRDPIARIESHHAHSLRGNYIDFDISEGPHSHAIETTKYYSQIKEYYDRFPAAKILLLNSSDLQKNPEATVKEVIDFLNLDNSYQLNYMQKFNDKTTSNTKLYQKLNKFHLMVKVGSLLPLKVKQGIMGAISKLSKYSKPVIEEHQYKLSEKQKETIMKELMPDLLKLEKEFHFDISRWKSVQMLQSKTL